MNKNAELWAGLDVGSTTVKLAIVDPQSKKEMFSLYERHGSRQADLVREFIRQAQNEFKDTSFKIAVCGSGGQPFADALGAPYVQEVVANSLAIRTFYPQVRTAVELGGQDAKAIFFVTDPGTGKPTASDMRMNGSCAGGTGAFLDQVSELLKVPLDKMNSMAKNGKSVYNISGRCGVFAKTDIQPLLNQGVSKEDIILSTFHALANQTIGGLTQGLTISPAVIFEGGPCAFNPCLIDVFKEKLSLTDADVVFPEHPEIIVAVGAALFIEQGGNKSEKISLERMIKILENFSASETGTGRNTDKHPYFKSEQEKSEFLKRHKVETFGEYYPEPETKISGYLGVDAGSTTSKLVLMDAEGRLLHSFYANNEGDPLGTLKNGLLELEQAFAEKKVSVQVLGMGVTGYGELMVSQAFHADFTTVETVAHAEAAQFIDPDVSFILDIGGQDMKAIFVENGIITQIILNEACSAGCGSFLETFARTLNIPVTSVAEAAFSSKAPSDLGSRCTVFMNSRIITEQRNGKTPEDIMAGLCRAVVENVFTKVIRVHNLKQLGENIVVQGGTFKNDAVLRAFEQFLERDVTRPGHPHLMGAIGIALMTQQFMESGINKRESEFIGLPAIKDFIYKSEPGTPCRFCQNRCNRTIMRFSSGGYFVTGNRCEKGQLIGDPDDADVKSRLKEINRKMAAIPDMFNTHYRMLKKNYPFRAVRKKTGEKIGLPLVLDFWRVLPFWRTLFNSLGFETVVSDKSSYPQFEKGLKTLPSDTICFPAKLSHGHIYDLIEKKVDRIFFPQMIGRYLFNAPEEGAAVCPVVQGYPMVIDKNMEPELNYGIRMDYPTFDWKNEKLLRKQVCKFLMEQYKVPGKAAVEAVEQALASQNEFHKSMYNEGQKILNGLKDDQFAVFIACRPYQIDNLISHNLSSYFTSLGIPVLTLDALPHHKFDMAVSRLEIKNPVHKRMLTGAMAVARDPKLEIAQVVSFGCGHDAILSDEITRLIKSVSKKSVLQLKLDETSVQGPLRIRVRSFITTVRNQRAGNMTLVDVTGITDPYKVKFEKSDKPIRKILVPNLSPSFSLLVTKILEKQGYKSELLPLATPEMIQLGKRYVNNDICFPAQINIGELLGWLRDNPCDQKTISMGLAKNCDNCRAGQYSALTRKALDEAGYPDVSIVTTADEDEKNIHPGYKADLNFRVSMVRGMAVVDHLEAMLRSVRPYEVNAGETESVYKHYLEYVTDAVKINKREMLRRFREAVSAFNAVESDRSIRRPRVGVLGEIFVKYHPAANAFIEKYLEKNGMEAVQPAMIDFFRRDESIRENKRKRNMLKNPYMAWIVGALSEGIYKSAVTKSGEIFKDFKYYEPHADVWELQRNIEGFMDIAFKVGEGWLIAGEMIDLVKHGVESFVIVQPFGCMPNHISGRGMAKALKKMFPHIQILSLDYDPDTSFANIENRLQMLIISALEKSGKRRI